MTPLPITWATKLIERLHMMYGAKFSQQWEGLDKAQMAQFWAEELAGFTGEEIAQGLQACKQRQFPPTLPEFIKFCRPWLDAEVAFQNAVRGMQDRGAGEKGNWVHPAVYWAAVDIGAHDLLNMPWLSLRKRWEAAYQEQLLFGAWEPIPDPVKALPNPKRTEVTDEQAKKAMQMINSVKPASKARDPKAWAKKILDNPNGRSPTVLGMARRALEASYDV